MGTTNPLPPLPPIPVGALTDGEEALLRAWADAHAIAALAQPSAPSAEPLKGWKLNHVQYVRGSGTAQIGYLDPEDDRFSPIVTVDTGLYYQDDQAAPLAIAILGAIADATTPAEPAAPMAKPEPRLIGYCAPQAIQQLAEAPDDFVTGVLVAKTPSRNVSMPIYTTPAAQPDSKGQR